jgi:putative ABC transport system permease protein
MLRELRYAVRSLWANPSFTLVAILALALGIGAATAIFTVVNGVLLKPLPFSDPNGHDRRDHARHALRNFVDRIVIPPETGLLQSGGELGGDAGRRGRTENAQPAGCR